VRREGKETAALGARRGALGSRAQEEEVAAAEDVMGGAAIAAVGLGRSDRWLLHSTTRDGGCQRCSLLPAGDEI
jgi:hypothetical protein